MESLRQSLNPNKLLKEEFVSNLTGSSMLEVVALSTIIPGLVVLRQWSSFARVNGKINVEAAPSKKDGGVAPHRRDFRSYAVSLSVDYLCIVLPVLLILTIFAEWVHMFTFLLIIVLLLCISAKGSSYIHLKGEHLSSSRATITSYRVLVVIMTCLSILAVDFKIFPRRYAKTETYGTSMMDLGVGSFVMVNALVSRKARNSISMNWMAVLKSTSPLILLGFGRLISTTGVDYQAHVGEYGVHWNFFFTLAAVSLLSSLFDIDLKYCGIVGLLILVGYQACLLYGLNVYLLSNERMADIVSQNKEGLFSIFGYWGMYLIGVHLGHYILFRNHSSKKARNIQATRVTVWIVSVLFWFLTIILDKYVERVSRRTCNLAYVTEVIAQNFQVLSILTLSDFIPYKKPLAIEEAFNQNLLCSFLMANVLTGLVNLSMDTLSASPVAEMIKKDLWPNNPLKYFNNKGTDLVDKDESGGEENGEGYSMQLCTNCLINCGRTRTALLAGLGVVFAPCRCMVRSFSTPKTCRTRRRDKSRRLLYKTNQEWHSMAYPWIRFSSIATSLCI